MSYLLSILCPTRHRPHRMRDVIQSIKDTTQDYSQIEMVFFIDSDDEESFKAAEELGKTFNVQVVSAPRYTYEYSDLTNQCQKVAKADLYHLIGDDILYRTNDWLEVVLEAFEKYESRILLCGGDDLLNDSLLTHPFIHKNWVDITGYVVPPIFRDMYADSWLSDVARRIGRYEQLPIIIEHLHFSSGKVKMDEISKERMSRIQKEDQAARVYFSTGHLRQRDADKLLKFIEDFKTNE